jgi:hypothetical protein
MHDGKGRAAMFDKHLDRAQKKDWKGKGEVVVLDEQVCNHYLPPPKKNQQKFHLRKSEPPHPMISIPYIFTHNNVAWLSFTSSGCWENPSWPACVQNMVRFLGTCHNVLATV